VSLWVQRHERRETYSTPGLRVSFRNQAVRSALSGDGCDHRWGQGFPVRRVGSCNVLAGLH
jgi:hypothetical protein